ncbi:MAG: type I DNA topoisomerase [Flavobacteriales bacterium]
MAKNLVIVESPAKAKTIEGYLGKDFTVKSSFGHVRDLPKKGLNVDLENNFKPNYEVSSDKKKVVTELRKLAKEAEMVWLATDEDREGEAISWHLYEALGLTDKKTKRITFNEITKTAVTKAIENPREINIDLVNAQQARRILDRIVGFELSPVLWKKVKPSLSAGRVQSVTVRLIVEREREIENFQSQYSYKVVGIFVTSEGKSFKAELSKSFSEEKEAEEFLKSCFSGEFTVKELITKPAKRTPAAPFTTSTLQQEASRKLGYSVSKTMTLAQKLYESGKITYMRTDSVNLSDTAVNTAKDEIIRIYGTDFSNPRKFKTKDKNAQEAHEAIRPTDFSLHTTGADSGEKKLYELIWKRTVASQMADAELERTTIKINISGRQEEFVANGEIIKFEGFLKVYLEGNDDDDQDEAEGMLPRVKSGEKLTSNEITATQRFTRPPARYTEASLVKQLEELGIGRPSTYAPTISTVQQRGYVVKEERPGVEREYTKVLLKDKSISSSVHKEITGAEKNKLFPTDIGIVVNDFLLENFGDVMDYRFTAKVEKEFDDIAAGIIEWTKMLKNFYGPFHKTVENTSEHSERATGERLLGHHPDGRPVYARLGRFGPMVQIGDSTDEQKPTFASINKEQSINTITLEDALDLFKLPRDLGVYDGKPVSIGVGRFGPYIKHGLGYVNIPKTGEDDPITMSKERAIELIENHKQAEKDKYISKFKEDTELFVLNGRYGAYIKKGKNNYRIPKGTEPSALTYEDCMEIINKIPVKSDKK